MSREQFSNHNASFEQWQSDKSLIEKLKVGRKDNFDPVPPQLLRKYIQYARKYVQPKLSSEAAKILQVCIDWKMFYIMGKKDQNIFNQRSILLSPSYKFRINFPKFLSTQQEPLVLDFI